jgi:O-antigen/teichoic acid export membrane protein
LQLLLSFFKSGHSRSVKVKRNIVLSFAIKGLNILTNLALVPLTIDYINPTQYGIWLTLSSIIAWFGFFDIGFGNGLRNKLAEAIAHGKHKLARIYVSTTYAILAIIVGAVLILFLCVNPFLNWATILNAPQSMAGELNIVALTVFVFFSVQFVLQLLTIVLNANQRPALAAMFNLLGNIFALLLIFLLTKTMQGKLLYLSLSLGLTPVIVLLISSIWFYSGQYKIFAPSFKFIQFKFGKNLMNLGIKFFIIQIAVVILYQTSNIIISQLYSPTEVTSYNIAFRYFSIIPMLFSIIISPFWSAFTEAWVKKDIIWINHIMRKLKLVWLGLSLLTVAMIIGSDIVYRHWIGDEVSVSFSLTITMAVYVIINLWNGIYSQFLNGVGIIKIQLIIAIVSSLVNIPLSIYLCRNLGVYGVILSTIIVSLIGVLIFPVQFRKIFKSDSKSIWVS